MELIEESYGKRVFKDGNTKITILEENAVKTQEEIEQLLKEIAKLYIEYLT